MVEYWSPYQPQYPFDHLARCLAKLLAKPPALFLYHQSCHENPRFPSQCPPTVPPPPYPFSPQYNVKLLVHHRPLSRSYPGPLLAYNASSKVALSSPSHRKLTNHRADGIYPSLHLRYAPISLLHVEPSSHFFASHIRYGGLLASNHLLRPAKHGQ